VLVFVLRRFFQAIPTLLGVSILSFLLLHIVPGSPVQVLLGQHYTPARAAALAHSLGLDKPLIVQYGIWLWNAVHLNFGYSYDYNLPVWTLITQNLPHTLVLVGISIMLAHLGALVLGMIQGYYRNSIFDYVVTTVNYFFYSMPSFWLGIILIEIFAIGLNILPAGGITNPLNPHPSFGLYVQHLVLPCATLILVSMAAWARYMRSAVIETLTQDYIRTARAKGLSEFTVMGIHVLRNSVLPLITLFGLSLPTLFAGALFVEEIFNYPGMGLLFWTAAINRDYPVLLGVVMLLGFLTVVGNLIADILYGVVDPRIQYN
jgi:peptide/nickel transport system permease protein